MFVPKNSMGIFATRDKTNAMFYHSVSKDDVSIYCIFVLIANFAVKNSWPKIVRKSKPPETHE